MRKYLIAVALFVSLAVVSLHPQSQPVAAQSQPDTGAATITTAYNLLLDDFVQPLDPDTLLNAAWQAVVAVSGAPASAGSTAPNLPSDRQGALAAFLQAYQSFVARATASPSTIANAAADSMAQSVNEQHTYYLDPTEYADEIRSNGGGDTSTGYGIALRGATAPYSNPPWLIASIVPGGPADAAGLKAGDTIQAVNGKSATGVDIDTLSSMLTVPAGTTIVLDISRPNAGSLQVQVQRGTYVAPILTSRILPGGVGLLRLTGFPDSVVKLSDGLRVADELDADLASFDQAGVQEWILDLRDNPGGSVTTADAIAGRFIADGVVSQHRDLRGHLDQELVDGHFFPNQKPMAVLINGGTASSGEVLASAIHEYGRGLLIGTRTAGALATNETFPLPNGGALAVTVANVTTGKLATVVNEVGIDPDVRESQLATAAELAAGTDPQITAAEQALQGATVPDQTAVPSPETLSKDDLKSMLSGYGISASDVPAMPFIPTPKFIGDIYLTHVNQIASGASDPITLRQTDIQRGWEGEYSQAFGQVPEGPGISVSFDVFNTDEGAYEYAVTNDIPDQLVGVDPPVQLGDGSVAYRGQWLANGSDVLVWRHGNLVLTVFYSSEPGSESFDPVVTVAQAVEARYQAVTAAQPAANRPAEAAILVP